MQRPKIEAQEGVRDKDKQRFRGFGEGQISAPMSACLGATFYKKKMGKSSAFEEAGPGTSWKPEDSWNRRAVINGPEGDTVGRLQNNDLAPSLTHA